MLEERKHLRHHLYMWIPSWIKKHDFELFAVFLCLAAGIPLLIGAVEPSSIDATMPRPVVIVWSLCLILGPILVLVGIVRAYIRSIHITKKVYWMRVEALGLSVLGWAAFVYGVAILVVNPKGGWLAAMITFVFSLTCGSREISVQEDIDELKIKIGAIDAKPR